jgi:peptidyl-prolyl cis-trans isomerase D
MLETLRRSQRWLMGAVVFLVGGVFVAYLGLGGPPASAPSAGAVVELDGRRYTMQDLQDVRAQQEARLRESLGDAFDAVGASAYLDQMATEALIQRAVLAAEAEALGLRATDDEVRQVVRSYFPGPDGRIDAEAAREYGERRYGSERRFANEIRDDILMTKLLRLIDAGVEVSDAEVRDALRYQREAVRLAIVVLDPSRPRADLALDEAAVEAMLADQSARVRAFYDEHPERFKQPERVRARHLLIRVASDASEEDVAKARERAEAGLARIRGGEDFAAVASELSEDPGSKDRGGDLGFFTRGQMVPPFEEVAFSLEPGQVSELVRTDFGFHVIRVEEHKPAEERSFDDAAREIAEELVRADRSRELALEQAAALEEAVREGKSLVDAARDLDVDIQRPDWITRRADGFVPGVGSAPELLATAFALTTEQPTAKRVFDVGEKKVLIELLERRTPSAEELAAELPAERGRLREALRAEARNAWLQAARRRLLEEGRLRVDWSLLRSEDAPPEAG